MLHFWCLKNKSIIKFNFFEQIEPLDSFQAKLLSHVITIASGETKPVIYLKYISREKDGFSSYLTLHTNVTNFKIPIVIFSGKLKVVVDYYLLEIFISMF